MHTLADVLARAETDLTTGRYVEALQGYVTVVAAAPGFARARYRVADTLLNLGDRARAKDIYRALAWHYIRAGQPLLGLVACKMVLALDPAYGDLLEVLAESYSSESDRVGDVEVARPSSLLEAAPAPPPVTLDGPALLELAGRLAADLEAVTAAPAVLPRIPLFSHLPEDAFLRVLASLRLRRFAAGERIIAEGEPGDSFFMLADGLVEVSKRVDGRLATLAHLHHGAVFGEMALVSSAPRAATVTALGDVDLLELSRRDLEGHAGELEGVKQALRKFTRGRFLANLAATSPLFRPLGKPERRALMARFQADKVFVGDVVIEEGEAGKGLFLVLRGALDVTRRGGAGLPEVKLATLGSGDVFGEMSLLRDAPTSASVTVTAPGEVLFLPREEFFEAVADFPEVRAALAGISEERLRTHGDGPIEIVTDDDLILL